MENIVEINKEVSIVAFYFRNRSERLKCYPKLMEYNGRRIEFSETGLRHPTKRGQRTVHVFDMSDGQTDYRLEFDAELLSWTLVSMADSSYASGSLEPAFAA